MFLLLAIIEVRSAMTHPRGLVLVVDDEEPIRVLLQRTLESVGYYVLPMASGQEALDTMSQVTVEVMLLDMRMPGLTGLDVLQRFSADSPDTCIIMITGVADVETTVNAMKAGAYDYVLKPFTFDDILVKVEKAREHRHLTLLHKEYQKSLEDRVASQTKEAHEMMAQAIHALAREELLLLELDAGGRKRKGLPKGTDVKEIGARIMRRIGGSG